MATEGREQRLQQHARRLRTEARALGGEIAGAWREGCDAQRLARTVAAHPIRSVLVAAGTGYLLGGGLLTPLTGRLLRIGGRALAIPLLQRQLLTMVAGRMTTH